MFKIFRTSSKKGDKKKKVTKSNKNQSNNDLNEEINSKPDGKSVEDINSESNKSLQRKDSIPIGIKWITQPSPHVLQGQDNSTNSSNDELRENNSTPSNVSQLTESRVSNLTESRLSQLTENRDSQLTENCDINVIEKDSICLKSSNTNQEAENLTLNDNINLSSSIPGINTNNKFSLENICNNINVQASLEDKTITNNDIKHSELLNREPQNILELLLSKFDKFEQNIMVELNYIKESQEKQEKRLSEIQSRQEEVNNRLNQITSIQHSSTVKELEVEEERLPESQNINDNSVPSESSKEASANHLPTIQEVDINVEKHIKDMPETDPQSPSISSSLMTSTVSSPVTSHTSEQPQAQDSLTSSSEPIADKTDVIVSTCESLSVSLPTPSPATILSPSTTLPEGQQNALSIMSVHNSVSKLEHLQSPISSRISTPVVPSPFRSSNPPIKHSPPTKPKRLSLQIPMSSSPSQGLSDDNTSCPLRRSIEWPEHSPVIHSPFAAHKPNVSLNSLRKVQDRDRRMFITITP